MKGKLGVGPTNANVAIKRTYNFSSTHFFFDNPFLLPSSSSCPLYLPSSSSSSSIPLFIFISCISPLALNGINPLVHQPTSDLDQRLTAMMVSVLVSRINPPVRNNTSNLIQMLFEISRSYKLGLMVAIFSNLDADGDHLRIHVVDFDLGRGQLHASLINAIVEHSRKSFIPVHQILSSLLSQPFVSVRYYR